MTGTTRFGFTKEHFALLGTVVRNPALFVVDAPNATSVSELWNTIPTKSQLTKAQWEIYKDGAYKLKTFESNVSSSCSEAQVCAANNFPTLLA